MTMQNPQTCLSAELLRQLSHDELSPAELKDVEDHVSDCERCRQLLEVPQSDPQWRDEIVPILRSPLESPHVAGDHDERGSEGESLESILRLLGPTDDPHMLGRIGSYEVVGVIGRGGMGVVFKAYEGALNRFVAIKMLLPHLAASGAARKRFAREGQAAAAVIDDNVMPIYSVAEWQGVPYLVTQYSRGATLQKRIQDQGPLDLKEILRIGMQTARGLAAAHAQGLVHRDVKPSNILLDGTVERALLTDFGLARAVDDASITRTGIIAGTPQYMSPEQARGGSVDARSDLFGLGCVLYAMCTGRPPFRADSSYAILRMITDDEPRSIREINPDIPEWLCLLISRLMAKSPDARFGNALEVAALLEQCLAHVQQPTSVPLPASLVPHATGHRSIFKVPRKGVLAMLGTIGMTLLGMVLWQATEAPDISGQWTSEEWGTVVLEAKQPGQYEGSFTGSGKGKSGTVQLKWSRVERRFNGTWGKVVDPSSLSKELIKESVLESKPSVSGTQETADDRTGRMSLRLVDNEIRGAWTTSKDAQKESGTPRLADLTWIRTVLPQTRPVENEAKAAKRSTSPKSAHIGGNVDSVMVVHDDVDPHYAFYYPGEFGTSSSGSQNTQSLSWMDEGSITLKGGRTFGYHRESTDPFHLRVNGKEYDLRQGRVLELRSDDSVEQLKLFPTLSTANTPAALAKLITSTRGMNEEPFTLEKTRLQLEAAEAQLRDLLKTHAPTHALVVEVSRSVEALQHRIEELTKHPGGAAGEAAKPLDRKNARAVVEAFVAAMISDDDLTAKNLFGGHRLARCHNETSSEARDHPEAG